MKQFEKWQNKALKYEYSPSVYRGAEKGWKAALKWALEQEEWQGTDDCGRWGICKEDIEEELEETENESI